MPSTKVDSPDVEPQPQVEEVKNETPTKKPIDEKAVEIKDANGDGEEKLADKDNEDQKTMEEVETKDETNDAKDEPKLVQEPANEEESKEPEPEEDGAKRKAVSNDGDKEVTPKKLKTDSQNEAEKETEDVTSSA